jgi:uncharacterized protein with PIN domain
VLITRDSGIAQRRAARMGQMRVVQIVHDDLRNQLRQLVRDMNLNLNSGFSRCVRCNQLLQLVPKQSAAPRLPAYVCQTQCQFMECPQCLRLYWRGTHWSNMMSELGRVYEEIT